MSLVVKKLNEEEFKKRMKFAENLHPEHAKPYLQEYLKGDGIEVTSVEDYGSGYNLALISKDKSVAVDVHFLFSKKSVVEAAYANKRINNIPGLIKAFMKEGYKIKDYPNAMIGEKMDLLGGKNKDKVWVLYYPPRIRIIGRFDNAIELLEEFERFLVDNK
ncbi:MAG: hypothetical protein QXQ18_01875 [Candidatus Aenigmatarchaeota archaeon]